MKYLVYFGSSALVIAALLGYAVLADDEPLLEARRGSGGGAAGAEGHVEELQTRQGRGADFA